MASLIFGCGYLGMRVAERWLASGEKVFAVTRREARAADKQRARAAERRRRELRDRVARTESEIEAAECAWEANNTQSAEPEILRDGARMQELTRDRRELEWKLRELYDEWERLGGELDALESNTPV